MQITIPIVFIFKAFWNDRIGIGRFDEKAIGILDFFIGMVFEMLDIEIIGAGASPMDVGDFEGFLFARELLRWIGMLTGKLVQYQTCSQDNNDSDSRDEGENNEKDDLVGLGHGVNLAENRDGC